MRNFWSVLKCLHFWITQFFNLLRLSTLWDITKITKFIVNFLPQLRILFIFAWSSQILTTHHTLTLRHVTLQQGQQINNKHSISILKFELYVHSTEIEFQLFECIDYCRIPWTQNRKMSVDGKNRQNHRSQVSLNLSIFFFSNVFCQWRLD